MLCTTTKPYLDANKLLSEFKWDMQHVFVRLTLSQRKGLATEYYENKPHKKVAARSLVLNVTMKKASVILVKRFVIVGEFVWRINTVLNLQDSSESESLKP